MKRNVWIVCVALLAMSALAAGCSAAKSSGGSGSTSPSGAASTPTYIDKPFPTITPESPNEKKAAAATAKSLATYITNTKLANKQNKRDDPIFDNSQGYKPRFVGYGFTIVSGKGADGKFRTVDVSAFDGGTQIKPMSVWEDYGSVTKGNGIMNDSYFAGVAVPTDPTAYLRGFTPVSASEKAAAAAVEAWAKSNLDPSLNKVVLSTYLFQWGEQTDRPNMMMSISPDGFSYNSVIAWGPTK